MNRLWLLAVISLLLICCSALSAGVLVVSTEENLKDKGTSEMRMYLDSDRMRIEAMDSDGTKSVMIFRGDKQLMWVIQPNEKKYMTITKEMVDQIGQMAGNANSMMEQMMANNPEMQAKMKEAMEKMKDLPPEQREMAEKMMQGQMGMTGADPQAAAASKTQYTRKGSGVEVNSWKTTHYEGQRNGQKEEDIWTANPESMGLTDADFRVMEHMGKFMEGLPKGQGSRAFAMKPGSAEWEKEMGYSGIPVKTVSYDYGQVSSTQQVKEVRKQSFASDTFDLPSGLTEQSMMGGMNFKK